MSCIHQMSPKVKKVKADIALHGNPSQSYGTSLAIWNHTVLPDTSKRAPPNPSHAGWYSIYLPRRDGRLSWPSLLDSAPAGSRMSEWVNSFLTAHLHNIGYAVPCYYKKLSYHRETARQLRLSRLTHWWCTSLSTASVLQLHRGPLKEVPLLFLR